MASETGMLGGRLPYDDTSRVCVLGASVEGALAGSPVAIGLHFQGRLGSVWVRDEGAPGRIEAGEPGWAGALAEWWAGEGVSLSRWGGDRDALTAPLVVVGGAELLEAPARPLLEMARSVDPDAIVAVAALGSEVARGRDAGHARRRLVELSAGGGLLHAEPVLRFGAAGRGFVELIENVNHRSGPDGQSLVADTLRAALFGRHGRVPVNLAARDRPPELDLTTLFVYFVAARELL